MKVIALASLLSVAMLSHAQQPPPPDDALVADLARSLYNRATAAYNLARAEKNKDAGQRFWQAAASNFQQLLTKFPDDPKANESQYFLARCYLETGDNEGANKMFQTIITQQRTGAFVAAAALHLASTAYNNKDFATAAKHYATLAANAPAAKDRLKGYYMLANCQQQLGNTKEAISAFETVINDPEVATTEYLHHSRKSAALLQMNAGNIKQALTHYKAQIQSSAPEQFRTEAALYAGVCCMKLDDAANAESFFQQVLKNTGENSRPYHADALTQVMELSFRRKDYAKVIATHQANPLNTKDIAQARRTHIVARSMMQMKRLVDAIPLFQQVRQLAGNDSIAFDAAYYTMLCAHQLGGNTIVAHADEFLNAYSKTHATNSRIHTALLIKAGALHKANKLKDATESYKLIDESLIEDANHANLLYNSANCFAATDNFELAISALTKFISAHTDDTRLPDAIALRGDCYLKTDKSESALNDFTKLLTLKPNSKLTSFAWQQSATIKKQSKDYAGMIDCYEKLLASSADLTTSTQADAHFGIGYGHDKLDQSENAVKHFQEARRLAPETYGKTAGLMLVNAHFKKENIEALFAEIDLAIDNDYAAQITPALITWAGAKAFEMSQPKRTVSYLTLVADFKTPTNTKKETWRTGSRAHIQLKDYAAVLPWLEQFLAQEKDAQNRSSALLDKALCLLKTADTSAAKTTLDQFFDLKPQGQLKTKGELLLGDYEMAVNNSARAQQLFGSVAVTTEDPELKPLALYKLHQALLANKETDLAEKYRKQLENEFPDWKSNE